MTTHNCRGSGDCDLYPGTQNFLFFFFFNSSDSFFLSFIEVQLLYNVVSVSAAAAAAKSLQSCPTLCDPRDGSPPGSPVPGILQARTLEWGAIAFSI